MKTPIKITFYSLIFLAHVYTVYHIQFNAGFMEETILAFTVGFMNSSEYQTYLNYLFDVFYCTLIAVYFFSRWSSKEVAVESSRDASTASTTSSASSKAIVASAGDPEAPDRPTTIAHITEQQPLKQQHQQNPPSEQNNLKPQQQQQSQQKQQHQQPQQQHQQKGPNNSKKGNNAKNNKNTRIHNNNNNSSNNVVNNNNQLSTTSSLSSSSASSNPGANSSNNYGRRGGAKNSITLEDGFDADENVTSGSVAAICGVTGSVAGGDLQFSVANLTFFDVICISFVFPLCLLAIYLGWNLQTSVEVSWLSWRFLWGWWTERWTWWRLLLCLLAVCGITFLIKPKKVGGKSD